MEEKVIDILKEIGLGKSEIDVYVDLLKSKASSATNISKRTRQHRSNVYDALKRLQTKGFVTEIINDKKKLFEAKRPEIILSYLKQKEAEVMDVLPLLEKIMGGKKDQEALSVSYGVTRVRSILNVLIESGEEIIFWGVPSNLEELLGEAFVNDMKIRMRDKNVPSKFLYSEHFDKLNKIVKRPLLEVRSADGVSTKAMMIISGEVVIMVIFDYPLMVVEMRGKEVSEWFKVHFEISWNKVRRL